MWRDEQYRQDVLGIMSDLEKSGAYQDPKHKGHDAAVNRMYELSDEAARSGLMRKKQPWEI